MKTVKVPAEMAELFDRAEEVVSRFFKERTDAPERGTIEIYGERYVLVRAASLSVEFFDLVRTLYGADRRDEADDFARSILFDLAHSVGKSDARNFHAKMNLTDPIAKLSAGPVHFAHSGWAFVEIFADSHPSPDAEFCLVYDHPYSFESDAWARAERTAAFPVCIMNAGYSSGWCAESFGIELSAAELLCRGKGDEHCRFVMAPPEMLQQRVGEYAEKHPELAPRITGYRIPDFFARKREEEAMRARQIELERELRQTQKLEALGRLAGGVAHDFNNLLAIVIGHTTLLQHKLPEGDAMQGGLARIIEAGERAAALTQQLLAFGRSQVTRPEPLDLNAVIERLARLLGPVLRDDVQLVLKLAPDAGSVIGDRGQIEQVLMNLAMNARDAMPAGGRIEIATDAEGEDGVGLTVSDDGVGMDAGTLARVFEPFFTTKGDAGTGLGLSTVYGIVRQSGGTIQATSEAGKGTTFHIVLPRTSTAVAVAKRVVGAPRTVRTADILLVEDRADLRALLDEMLKLLGHRPCVASSPEDALAILSDPAVKIDLLLTDVVMPRVGGVELARRAREGRPGLRVLFMSGFARDPRDRELLGSGSTAFLPKPFTPGELAEKLDKLLAITG